MRQTRLDKKIKTFGLNPNFKKNMNLSIIFVIGNSKIVHAGKVEWRITAGAKLKKNAEFCVGIVVIFYMQRIYNSIWHLMALV